MVIRNTMEFLKFIGFLVVVATVWFGIYYVCGRPTIHWGTALVGSRGRGPNADTLYRTLEVDGDRMMFTSEQVEVARERAKEHWPQ